ncbi:MAG TPA: hypothetical protein VJ804_15075 [Acidimicrobiales bacterium]|nr:hypothetical protein [Acidimicrobiales bacterium]
MTTAKTTRKPASKPPRKAAPEPVVRAKARRARSDVVEVPEITARTAPIPEYPVPTRPAVPPWIRPAASESTAVVSSVRGSRLAAWLRR